MPLRTLLLALLCLVTSAFQAHAQAPWQMRLREELPLLGHRNWIVIADSAYPWQTAPGVETIYTGESQIDVVRAVLDLLRDTKHVKPIAYLDAELAHVPEADAPGINQYRVSLKGLLESREMHTLPHEEIIAKLDAAGTTFHVLLLKTNLTIPYTTVFLQLDCAYWNADAEKRLREAMAK